MNLQSSDAPPRVHRLLRLWLVAETVVLIAGCLPWLVAAGLSVMAFDAPGSEGNSRIWAYVLPLWFYPIWSLVPLLLAWFTFTRGRNRAAAILLLTPLVIGAAYSFAVVAAASSAS